MLQGDAQHTGASSYIGPEVPWVKWSFEPGGGVLSSPAIGPDGTLYTGSSDGKVYAVSHDGAQKWSVAVGNPLLGTPAISADGTIYFGSYESDALAHDATLYAINPEGSLKWSFSTKGAEIFPPAIGFDGTIYIGVGGVINTPGAGLYAFTPDGSLKWRTYEPVDGAPAIDADGKVYTVGSCSGVKGLHAFNPAGQLDWRYPLGGCPCSSPTIGADGTIYVSDAYGILHAVDPDGSLKRSIDTGPGVHSGQAITTDGITYVASQISDNVLYGIGPEGSQEWDFAEVPGVQGAPGIGVDGTIYVASEQKYLYAFNPDGSVKWLFPTEGAPRSSPVIGADGTIYFVSGNGKLYSLGEAPSGTPVPLPGPRYTLRINQTTWEPGQDFSTIQLNNGKILVDPPPDRDGAYAAGTSVSLIAYGFVSGSEVLWSYVDGADTAENTFVVMNADKVVLVTATIQSAPPTPVPSRAPAGTPTPAPFPGPTPASSCTPTLIVPADGAVLDNGRYDGKNPITWKFDWSSCPGATKYHLQAISNNGVVRLQQIMRSSAFSFDSGGYIDDKRRTWKVQAFVGGQWGEWSETRSFHIEPVGTDLPSRRIEASYTAAPQKMITGCGLTEIGNHTPPSFFIIMTFKLDALDHDHGIGSGEYDPVGGYAISAWGFNRILREFQPFHDASRDSDFSLISGANGAGQLGTYQLEARYNAGEPLYLVDQPPGYYFRIVDENGNVIYIGAGGQQYISEDLVQSNTIPYGSGIIDFP